MLDEYGTIFLSHQAVPLCHVERRYYGKRFCEKKGKKWYFRFYVEDESGNRIQKEMSGTESKSETESLLRKAMEEYENHKFVAKAANVTLADMLDMWMVEELNPSKRSNGTAHSYINTVNRVNMARGSPNEVQLCC